MEYKDFLTLVMTNKKLGEDLSELHDIGFDFFEGKYQIVSHIERIIDTAFGSHYDEDGVEWINWFMYESDYGQKDWSQSKTFGEGEKGVELSYGAQDKDGNPICYSYESLWEYLETNHRLHSRYTIELEDDIDTDIYTVEAWEGGIRAGLFSTTDGMGYWVKNGRRSTDEVFSSPKFDATHVTWYGK